MSNYSIVRDMDADEVFVSPSTADNTGNSIQLTVTTSGAVTVLPQYSVDSGDNWTDDGDGSYSLDTETDVRTITNPGILRVTVTETDSVGSGITIIINSSTTAEQVVTTADVYRATGLSSAVVSVADVKAHILRGISEGRLITGIPLGTEQATEYYWGNNKVSMFLSKNKIISLDALEIGGDTITTSYVDVVQNTGQIILKTTAEASKFTLPGNEIPSTGARNITATFTWGYYNIPYWYMRLVEILASLATLTEQMGATSDDVTSYSIGDVSASKGEPFTNIRATMFELQREKKEIIERYVRKRVAVY